MGIAVPLQFTLPLSPFRITRYLWQSRRGVTRLARLTGVAIGYGEQARSRNRSSRLHLGSRTTPTTMTRISVADCDRLCSRTMTLPDPRLRSRDPLALRWQPFLFAGQCIDWPALLVLHCRHKVFRYSIRSQRSSSLSSGPMTPVPRPLRNSCPPLELPGCESPG